MLTAYVGGKKKFLEFFIHLFSPVLTQYIFQVNSKLEPWNIDMPFSFAYS